MNFARATNSFFIAFSALYTYAFRAVDDLVCANIVRYETSDPSQSGRDSSSTSSTTALNNTSTLTHDMTQQSTRNDISQTQTQSLSQSQTQSTGMSSSNRQRSFQPLNEAQIMTRSMIKFNTMVTLMNLPRDCDLPTVSDSLF